MKRLIRNKQEVKQMFFKTSTFIALGIVIFLFSACASTITLPTDYMKDITQGKLITPGCKIESITGEFVINSGEIFTPPFQNQSIYYNSSGQLIYQTAKNGINLIDKLDDIVGKGARKVRVTIPGLNEKLYGVLWLGNVHKTATGPQSRSYQIEIPQTYVNAALGGNVSVIYELADFKYFSPRSNAWYDFTLPTWVLWISDMPIGEEFSGVACGILPEIKNDGAHIIGIYPNSNAEKEGLKIGDIITSVNGESVIGISEEEYMERTKGEEGTEITFDILRDGVTKKITVAKGIVKY